MSTSSFKVKFEDVPVDPPYPETKPILIRKSMDGVTYSAFTSRKWPIYPVSTGPDDSKQTFTLLGRDWPETLGADIARLHRCHPLGIAAIQH